jgi:hypothetical protein
MFDADSRRQALARRDVLRYAGVVGLSGLAGVSGLGVLSTPATASVAGAPRISSGLTPGTFSVSTFEIEYQGLPVGSVLTIEYVVQQSGTQTPNSPFVETHTVAGSSSGTLLAGGTEIEVPAGSLKFGLNVTHPELPTSLSAIQDLEVAVSGENLETLSGGAFESVWDTVNGSITTTHAKTGTYSFRVDNTSNALGLSGLSSTPGTLGFRWYETIDNTGIAYKMYGTDGGLIDSVGSSNPDRESETHNPQRGSYDKWEGVTMEMDWVNQQITYDWDSAGSYTRGFYNSSASELGEIAIGSYQWTNGGSAKNPDFCWIDRIHRP